MAENIAVQRIKMRERMLELLEEYPKWAELSKEKKETNVRRMERSCFAHVIAECVLNGIDRLWTEPKFVQRYSAEIYRVIVNGVPNSTVGNTYLIDRVLDGGVDPNNVAELSNHEMCPAASKAERDEILLRKQQKIEEKVSHAYICRKCGKNDTVALEYQGRCADEGSSISIKCVHCKHVWRI